jgi:glycosyltransferase involved in cell wall biosynthesis
MILTLDARLYGLKHAGIGRYVKNLTDRLMVHPHIKHLNLIVSEPADPSLQPSSKTTLIPTATRHYSLKEQVHMLRLFNKINSDLIHIPHFNVPLLLQKPFIVTIHDILWHHTRGHHVTTLPAPLYYAKYLGYRSVMSHAVKKSQTIITPSEFVKNQVTRQFGLNLSPKITVTPEGVDYPKTIPSPKPPKPYLLYIGSLYPHKNVEILLKALRLPSTQSLSLKVISSRSVFTGRFKKQVGALGLQSRVEFLGFVKDSQVQKLYHVATALVAPSLSEGFGLTGIEAMAHGCPVIAARAGSLPEVYKDSALFFDPNNENQLAAHVSTLVQDSSLRLHMINQGRAHAAQFSWDTMTDQTIAVYQSALKARSKA